jgi:hypothetical protein
MLGIRMLVQGGVELARPRHDVIRVGAAVDATHALSMVGVALVSPRYRRGAVISAAIATASAAALSLTEAAAR